MRVVIFLVCLCSLLSGRNDAVYTDMHPGSTCYSPTQPIEQALQPTFSNTDQGYPEIKRIPFNAHQENFFHVDAEEDDSNDFFAKRYKFLNRNCIRLLHTFLPSNLHNCVKERPPFYSCLSCKYITLGVLRI